MKIGPPTRLLHDRILLAALEFCKEEAGLSAMRKATRRCTEISRGDPSVGDPGQGPCDPLDIEPCEACRDRRESEPVFKGSLKRRYQAKRRMMTAYARLTADAPGERG